ncbi:MAG: hypothetical protein ACRDFS_00490 [Chloroflexota bacterium]
MTVLAGCGASATRTPTATVGAPSPSDAAVVGRDLTYLRDHSFNVDRRLDVSLKSVHLHIFHSLCAGSTDGHCQEVAVFRDGQARPIWQRHFTGVRSLKRLPNGFAITAESYAPSDPLCCPSMAPVTDSYIWTGSGFREKGPLPKPAQG